jgi:uncharacterized protein (TIGR04141 family)
MFESGVTDFDDAIRPEILTGPNAYKEIPMADLEPADLGVDEVKIYFQRNKPSAPRWLDFFRTFVDFEDIADILNMSNSLIVLMKKTFADDVHMFAIPAGMGFHGLMRENLEPGFGCRVSLNTIGSDQVKAADTRTLDPNPRMKRSVIGRPGTVYELDIDPEEDLLNFIAGRPENTMFARKISGSDSLHISRDLTAVGIGSLLTELYEQFKSNAYKIKFPTLNSFTPVTSQAFIDELDEKLLAALQDEDEAENVLFVHPDINTWEGTSFYELRFDDESLEISSLESESLKEFIDEHADDVATFRQIMITGYDDVGTATIDTRDLYDYCVFETRDGDFTYHLARSIWYEIPREYIDRVNTQIERLSAEDSVEFPDWGKTLNENTGKMSHLEGDYNISTSGAFDDMPGRKFICLDKRTVRIPGGTSIEVCDIFSDDGLLIHVKKSSGSATLGHLWNQGLVSSELLASSPLFRQELIDKIKDEPTDVDWPIPFDATEFNPGQFRIVYGVGIKSSITGEWSDILPLFAKVALLNVSRKLAALNYEVKINRINMV